MFSCIVFKVKCVCCVKLTEEVQLGPAELVFLLEDMWRKLDFSLSAAPVKKAPFLKVCKHTPDQLIKHCGKTPGYLM